MSEQITQSATVSNAALKAFETKYSAWKASSDSTKALNRELANIFDWQVYVSPRGKNKALALLTVKRYDVFTRKLDDILAKVRGESWTSKTDDARKKDLGGYISDWRLTALEQQDFDLFDATEGKLEFINLQKIDGEMKPAVNKRAIADAKAKKAAGKAPQQPTAPKTAKELLGTSLTSHTGNHGHLVKYINDVAGLHSEQKSLLLDLSQDLLETLTRMHSDCK